MFQRLLQHVLCGRSLRLPSGTCEEIRYTSTNGYRGIAIDACHFARCSLRLVGSSSREAILLTHDLGPRYAGYEYQEEGVDWRAIQRPNGQSKRCSNRNEETSTGSRCDIYLRCVPYCESPLVSCFGCLLRWCRFSACREVNNTFSVLYRPAGHKMGDVSWSWLALVRPGRRRRRRECRKNQFAYRAAVNHVHAFCQKREPRHRVTGSCRW